MTISSIRVLKAVVQLTNYNPISTKPSPPRSSEPENMPLPVMTSQEKPSTSETDESTAKSQPLAGISDQASTQSSTSSSAAQQAKSDVERAADKAYEERIEEEYAKREGGA